MSAATASKHLHFLITGGSRGIGLACARRFAEQGHSTTLLSRDATTLEAAVKGLAVVRDGQRHDFFVGDVGREETWEGVKRDYKHIDGLLSAAGLSQQSLLASTSASAIASLLSTNLQGTILGSRTVSGLLLRRRSPGVIVNVASILGVAKHIPGTSVYAATKAGVVGFSRSLAAELRDRGIRVNAVCPGYVKTDMTAGLNQAGRWVAMEEVVDAVEFVVRNEAMNGAEVVVDGGLRLG